MTKTPFQNENAWIDIISITHLQMTMSQENLMQWIVIPICYEK
jgi:hypothetical protein